MEIAGKSFLVTGASGFIGQHLTRKIRSLGGFVHGLQHLTTIPKECVDMRWYGDLRQPQTIRDIVFNSSPDYVIHLASQAIVGKGQSAGNYTLETNIAGTINLLSALADLHQDKPLHSVIVASTDKVYGRHAVLPYTEDYALLGTQQVYEASKNCEDVIAQMAKFSWKLPIGITRFGNVYGPGDTNMSRIIPSTIVSLLHKQSPIIRSDGQHYRDFIFVDDVVNGYLRLAEYIHSINKYTENYEFIFNFGTGVPVRILDLVAMISEQMVGYTGKVLPPTIQYLAKDEIHKQYVGASLSRTAFGWQAVTKLKDGIDKTISWYRDNFESLLGK